MRRILSSLRSPRLALALVLGIAAYSVVGTIVPQSTPGSAAWAGSHPLAAAIARPLGLFSAFTSPVFLLAVALLTASLASCAWARSRAAGRMMTRAEAPSGPTGALEERPRVVVGPLAPRDADAIAKAEGALRRHGYTVAVRESTLAASRRRWGALGSPVFHWSLAMLVLVIVGGQLTHAEGHLPVPLDGRATDVAASYSSIRHGPLFPGLTGLEFGAGSFETRTPVGGVDRGPSAVISVYRGGHLLARQRVYPNAPLRYGPLLVHPDTWGYGPLLTVETTAGETVAQVRGFIPSSAVTSAGAGPGDVRFSGGPLGRVDVRFGIPAERVGADGFPVLARALRVTVTREGEAASPRVVVEEGRRIPLANGLWLRFAKRGTSVSVIVTNDWSVPFVYALFAIACLGLTVALFFPAGRVWAMMVQKDGQRYVHVVTAGSRADQGMQRRVAEIMREALPCDVEVR